MFFKKYLLPAVFSLLSVSGYAAELQQQLAAVAQAERDGKQQEQLLQDAQQAQRERDLRGEQQRRARAAAAQADADRRRNAARQAVHRQVLEEQQAARVRNQSYEDELRSLNIQQQKLALDREAARVKRENDFIDQELKASAAKTDVVQSEADANRTLSAGGKDLMQSEGRAREKKAGSWFH